ncbi:protein-L-isoaspartate O-methyltransferase family protein [Pseudactinotalea sp.]|uniref:protein-L-isoaspartate O-methyltransferase family protein n=1 Tax=Pseudactinotalea sp. TaxID=1926260 RepID=UPI003B3ADD6F
MSAAGSEDRSGAETGASVGARPEGTSDRFDAVFSAAPRAWFLPEGARERASHDGPILIGHEQTCSQPRTVRDMLALLEVQPGQRVLDVGSGSGWTTALLAELVGPHGRVRGVEIEPDLVAWGATNLTQGPWPWASIEQARPDAVGLPEHGPYNRILVSAEAREIPADLLEQLADDARMVLPVCGTMTLVERAGGADEVTEHGSYRFVPLR